MEYGTKSNICSTKTVLVVCVQSQLSYVDEYNISSVSCQDIRELDKHTEPIETSQQGIALCPKLKQWQNIKYV